MSHPILKSFVDDRRGAIAVIFALSLLPVVVTVGAAVDYSRVTQVRDQLQTATDAIALQLCQANARLTPAQLRTAAQATLTGMMPNSGATADEPVILENPRRISITTRRSYATAVMQVVGYTTIPVEAQAECEAAERFFEIALSLDTTGSMATSDGSMRKIDALKRASTDFVNYVYNTAKLSSRSRIALVPFSAAVAVDPSTSRNASWIDQNGTSTYHWQNVAGPSTAFKNRLAIFDRLRGSRAAWDWAGCFESLPYPRNVSDGGVNLSDPNSYYVPMFAPDEVGEGGSSRNSYIDDSNGLTGCTTNPSDAATRMRRSCKYEQPRDASASDGRGPNYMCRSRPLTRLTADRTKLLSEIAALDANGNTNIHEGMMWGWRTLSPLSVFGDGVAYTDRRTTKVLVLMSDGMNTWGDNNGNTLLGSIYSAYGYFKNADGSTPNGRLPPANANPSTDAQARAAMDALTREACTNARAAGVQIFTIGFSIRQDPIDAQGLSLLRDCAGQADRAFVATNADGLIEVFKSIAQGIGQLRIKR